MGQKIKKIGLLINPISGMGGSVGLKGTDEKVLEAITLGAIPKANNITYKALENIKSENIIFYTGEGLLGEEVLKDLNFSYKAVPINEKELIDYSTKDTIKVCEFCNDEKVDLFLFAGGDGTARNIVKYLNKDIAVLGISTGVKMQSGVFVFKAAMVSDIVNDWLSGKINSTIKKEVIDLDEEQYRQNKISVSLYGYLNVLNDNKKVQNKKSSPIMNDDANKKSIALKLIDNMEDNTLYLVGPGSTTNEIMNILKLPYTLLGFDIIKNKKILKEDVNENDILEILNKEINTPKKIILTPIGGQGMLLGRGNQQVSSKVMSFFEKQDIIIIATEQKMSELCGNPLYINMEDEDMDKSLAGYYPIITNYNKKMINKVI